MINSHEVISHITINIESYSKVLLKQIKEIIDVKFTLEYHQFCKILCLSLHLRHKFKTKGWAT